MMMWQRSAPSSWTIPTHQHSHLRDVDSPSDPPELLVEETLESQEEYPQEVAEEAEEAEEEEEEAFLLQYQCNMQLLIQETNLLATRRSCSQETAQNQKHL